MIGGVSYRGLRALSEPASRVGRANRARNTRPELLLRRLLWKRGLRYRLHADSLEGRPDLVLARGRVAVFCDGDFWHGRYWARRKEKLTRGSNASYWVLKIQRNIERDRWVARRLKRLGWSVVRVWEGDLLREPDRIAEQIAALVRKRANKGTRATRPD